VLTPKAFLATCEKAKRIMSRLAEVTRMMALASNSSFTIGPNGFPSRADFRSRQFVAVREHRFPFFMVCTGDAGPTPCFNVNCPGWTLAADAVIGSLKLRVMLDGRGPLAPLSIRPYAIKPPEPLPADG
jgi:hypothetical protein